MGPAVLAGIVGDAGALAYLLALVAMPFVAYAFILFSRSFNSSSSVYAFNGSTLGARYGFVSVWLLLLVYVSFAAGCTRVPPTSPERYSRRWASTSGGSG